MNLSEAITLAKLRSSEGLFPQLMCQPVRKKNQVRCANLNYSILALVAWKVWFCTFSLECSFDSNFYKKYYFILPLLEPAHVRLCKINKIC